MSHSYIPAEKKVGFIYLKQQKEDTGLEKRTISENEKAKLLIRLCLGAGWFGCSLFADVSLEIDTLKGTGNC